MIRRAPIFLLLLLAFERVSLACSPAAGAEDTTGSRVATAMVIFVLGLLVAVAHLAVFIYRKWKNKWVFWITFALSLIIMPISLFVMMALAGTACGFGTIEIAGFTLVFQIVGLAAQLWSWKFPSDSYRLDFPR